MRSSACERTGLYLTTNRNLSMPTIPEFPTREDAQAALNLLKDLLKELTMGGEDLVFKPRAHHTTYDIKLLDIPLIIRVTQEPLAKNIARKIWGSA